MSLGPGCEAHWLGAHTHFVVDVVLDTWTENLTAATWGREGHFPRQGGAVYQKKGDGVTCWEEHNCGCHSLHQEPFSWSGTPGKLTFILIFSFQHFECPVEDWVQGRTSARLTEHISAAQERTNLGKHLLPQALFQGQQQLRSRADLVNVWSSFNWDPFLSFPHAPEL